MPRVSAGRDSRSFNFFRNFERPDFSRTTKAPLSHLPSTTLSEACLRQVGSIGFPERRFQAGMDPVYWGINYKRLDQGISPIQLFVNKNGIEKCEGFAGVHAILVKPLERRVRVVQEPELLRDRNMRDASGMGRSTFHCHKAMRYTRRVVCSQKDSARAACVPSSGKGRNSAFGLSQCVIAKVAEQVTTSFLQNQSGALAST